MDQFKQLAVPGAIAFAGLLVATALLLGGRFETRQTVNVLWVTDRLTGHVTYCVFPAGEATSPPSCTDLSRNEWSVVSERAATEAERKPPIREPFADLGIKK